MWSLIAVTAFAFGYWLSNAPRAVSDQRSMGVLDRSSARSEDSSNPNAFEPQSKAVASSLSSEQMRIRAFQIKTEQLSRVQRMQQLCELLEQVTPENWRGILDGWETGMTPQGGSIGENYSILLEHVGGIAGAASLEEALKSDKAGNAARTNVLLKGWADANPKAALAWFLAQPDEVRGKYHGHFLAGLSRQDPKAALDLTFQSSAPYYKNGTDIAVINNAMSSIGVAGLEEFFTSMRARAELPVAAKNDFFAILTDKQLPVLTKADDPASAVLAWYENHAGKPYVDSRLNSRMLTEASKSNASAALSWAELNANRLPLDHAAIAFVIAATELQKQSPQEVANWLASNPEHPRRDEVLSGATHGLLQTGDFTHALQMANSIANKNKLSLMVGTVQKQQQAKAAQPAR